MVCPNCKKEIPDYGSYCNYCGKHIENDETSYSYSDITEFEIVDEIPIEDDGFGQTFTDTDDPFDDDEDFDEYIDIDDSEITNVEFHHDDDSGFGTTIAHNTNENISYSPNDSFMSEDKNFNNTDDNFISEDNPRGFPKENFEDILNKIDFNDIDAKTEFKNVGRKKKKSWGVFSAISKKPSKTKASQVSESIALEEHEYDYHLEKSFKFKKWFKDNRHSFVNILITILVFAAIVSAIFFLFKAFQDTSKTTNSNQPEEVIPIIPPSVKEVNATVTIAPVHLSGEASHVFLIESENGHTVKIFNKQERIKEGQAEVIFKDHELFTLLDSNGNDKMTIDVEVEITSVDYEPWIETFTLDITKPEAYLEVQQPAEPDITYDGSSYLFIMDAAQNARIFINDNEYTDIMREGHLELSLNIPAGDMSEFMVKVVVEGYIDTEKTYILRRSNGAFPLDITETEPIKTQGEIASITGTTHPDAILTFSLESTRAVNVNPKTGGFLVTVKAGWAGYNLLQIKAIMGDEELIREIAVLKEVSAKDFTRSVWALPYDKMKANPSHQNGRGFLIEGKVQQIVEQLGDKTIFLVAANNDVDKLVRVEFWGVFNKSTGDSIRVFANHWGAVDDMPRFLAPFIY